MRWMIRWSGFFVVAVVVAIACRSAPPVDAEQETVGTDEALAQEVATETPKRIILFIGDGMGMSALTAAGYLSDEPLAMLEMSHFGLMATHEHEFVTTDSAASATAMATGQKTHFNAVSVTAGTEQEHEEDPEHQLRTMVEAARDADWKTGLVATTRINHATPAPFAAHRHHRRQYEDLALDMSKSGVDVLLGAGTDFFVQREDERDLLGEMADEGYAIAGDADAVRESAQEASRLVGLMHSRDMPWLDTGERAMDLDEMVTHSLEVLDRDNQEGFFLMVEGSLIDWGGHALDGDRAVSETLDMDRAVARALEYARDRDDTLVVVTADHETGAMDVIDGPTADRYLEEMGGEEAAVERTIPEGLDEELRQRLAGPFVHFELGDLSGLGPSQLEDRRLTTSFGYLSSASRAQWDGQGRFSAMHTPAFVPLMAQGVGAEKVATLRDNADLGRQLMAWIDGEEADVQRAGDGDRRVDDVGAMPRNVVLLIGRGFGTASLTASYYHHGMPALFDMSHAAVVSTHGADALVNDAAGAATALATGQRTRLGAVGKVPDDNDGLQAAASALQIAAKSGKRTGIVSTGAVTDATAAAFFAHQSEYGDAANIAEQFAGFAQTLDRLHGVDFVAGAGAPHFDEKTRAMLGEQGYEIKHQWGPGSADVPELYLFEEGVIPPAIERGASDEWPSLAEMAQRAVDKLSDGEEGFFLVIDAAQIEGAKNEFDRGQRLMAELGEFDDTVSQMLDFAAHDGQTLVIASADRDHTLSVFDNHYGFNRDRCAAATDCGGDFEVDWFDVAADEVRHGEGFADRELQGDFGMPQIALQYTWMAQEIANHGEATGASSANFVPLFAEGVGASQFGGFMDQPEVGQWLVNWASSKPVDEPGSLRSDGGS